MSGFNNSVVGGQGVLVRNAIHSPDYSAGVAGWTVNRDGSAEFNNVTMRGTLVITNTGEELLVYDGAPAAGTLIASIAAQAGTDEFGNAFPQGVQVGEDATAQLRLIPSSGQQFASGQFQAALELTTTDGSMIVPGTLGGVMFNQGLANQQMASVFQSPIGAGSGTALVLTADSDDATVAATVTIGTVTVANDAVSYTPIIEVDPYGVSSTGYFVYGTAGETTTTISATGAATWTAPAGVTSVKVECWGAGGGGQGGSGGGGGGGEYAAEYTLAVTPGTTYGYSIGSGGAGGPSGAGGPGSNGGNTTFTGDSVTVTAHGGKGSNSASTAGGTGSTNSVHHDGGGSAANSTGTSKGGAGGGASGGYSAAGTAGHSNSGTTGGPGGAAVTGGGAGGNGGNGTGSSGTAGKAGGAPGGGGGTGGAGSSSNSAGGRGGNGQIRLTYTPTTNPISASISPVAGTDVFGNSYPAGITSAETAILSKTTDAAPTPGNRPALVTGDVSGAHLRVDGNEILAMSGDATVGTLFVNGPDGAAQPVMFAGDWTALPLQSGYQALSGAYVPAYRNISRDVIELRGAVQKTSGAIPSDVQFAVLPAGFRPAAAVNVAAGCSVISGEPETTRVQVFTGGSLRIEYSAVTRPNGPTWVSLDGIQFSTT